MTNFYFTEESNIVSVHLATDISVNAWRGTVAFPETSAVARIMNDDTRGFMWQTIPHITSGRGIEFAGGVPGGVTGDVVLFRFALNAAPSSLSFATDTLVYLNDGQGTAVRAGGSVFAPHVVAGAPSFPADIMPPEPFTPELVHDPSFFDGHAVALFSTRDLQSGIGRYEVREITSHGASGWQPAQSPYLLADEVTKLEIRAIDNAGNIREEALHVQMPAPVPYAALVAFAGAIALLLVVYTKFRQWRRN